MFLDKNPGIKMEPEVSEQTCDRIYMKFFGNSCDNFEKSI